MSKIEKLTQAITDFFAEKGRYYGYDDETSRKCCTPSISGRCTDSFTGKQ